MVYIKTLRQMCLYLGQGGGGRIVKVAKIVSFYFNKMELNEH